jgi:hypothetical protein
MLTREVLRPAAMRVLVIGCLLVAACGPNASGDSGVVDAAHHPDAHPGPDGPMFQQSEVYAHSGSELYRIDTNNLDVIDIGPFGAALGTASMTDIAVDKNGGMVGVSLSKIFSIDPATGTATQLATFNGSGNLTSLSYVPDDPTNPNSTEKLVTAGDTGDVYQVNPSTGATTQIGNFGTYNGHQIVSSGDIVSVYGFGTIATVNATANLSDPDFLATIDPNNGWAATPIGTATTGYDRIFGLAFWGGTVFGFVDNGPTAGTGSLVTIDTTTGVATPVNTEQFRWYGAGVTTIAPIVN